MSNRESFITVIFAKAFDALAGQVFADWLDEQGSEEALWWRFGKYAFVSRIELQEEIFAIKTGSKDVAFMTDDPFCSAGGGFGDGGTDESEGGGDCNGGGDGGLYGMDGGGWGDGRQYVDFR